jgi:hypothetical protein
MIWSVAGQVKDSNERDGKEKFNFSPNLRVGPSIFSLLTLVSGQYFGSRNRVLLITKALLWFLGESNLEGAALPVIVAGFTETLRAIE